MTTSPELECNDCGKNFAGGATRIKEHILKQCHCSTTQLQALRAKLRAQAVTQVNNTQPILEQDRQVGLRLRLRRQQRRRGFYRNAGTVTSVTESKAVVGGRDVGVVNLAEALRLCKLEILE